jgi:hypothetical protein
MGRYASDTGGGDFKPAPHGTHIAICIGLTDLGTQHGEYQGKPTVRNQLLVTWELPEETFDTDDGPKPFIVSKFYTNSLSEKANLRADLVSWRGRDFTAEEIRRFDLQAILGKPCLLSIVHDEKDGRVRAKVKAVMAVAKGTKAGESHNAPKAFWLDKEEWSQEAFDELPEGIQKIIKQSDEYKAMHEPAYGKPAAKQPAMADMDSDEIPFANPYRGRFSSVV